MPEICIAKYRWTREEHISARLHHQRTKLRRGVVLLMKVFSAVLLALIVIVLLASILFPGPALPFWPFFVLAVICIYCLIFERVDRWYWSRGFAKRPDANIQIEWQFSREELKLKTELGEATSHWKGVLKVVETSEGFLFYSLKNLFHWIPFSAFESPDCIEEIRKWLRENNIPFRRR